MNTMTSILNNMWLFSANMLRSNISDIKPEDLDKRIDDTGNSIGWNFGHCVAHRYHALRLAGIELENPFLDKYGAGVDPAKITDWMTKEELLQGLDDITEKLTTHLESLSEEELLDPKLKPSPVSGDCIQSKMEFLLWHESNHVGQISLARKLLGYPTALEAYRNHQQNKTTSN